MAFRPTHRECGEAEVSTGADWWRVVGPRGVVWRDAWSEAAGKCGQPQITKKYREKLKFYSSKLDVKFEKKFDRSVKTVRMNATIFFIDNITLRFRAIGRKTHIWALWMSMCVALEPGRNGLPREKNLNLINQW